VWTMIITLQSLIHTKVDMNFLINNSTGHSQLISCSTHSPTWMTNIKPLLTINLCYLSEILKRSLSALWKKEKVYNKKFFILNIEGEEPPAEEPPAEEGEESKKVEQLSDLSEEEEIKVPPKDLTGIVFFQLLTLF